MVTWSVIRKGAAVAAVVGFALVVTAAGLAKDGDVLVRGTCTKSSTSKLKLSREDDRVEAEFEVDQNRSGVTWRIVLERSETGRVCSGELARRRRRPARSRYVALSPIRLPRIVSRRGRRAPPASLHGNRIVLRLSAPNRPPTEWEKTRDERPAVDAIVRKG